MVVKNTLLHTAFSVIHLYILLSPLIDRAFLYPENRMLSIVTAHGSPIVHRESETDLEGYCAAVTEWLEEGELIVKVPLC